MAAISCIFKIQVYCLEDEENCRNLNALQVQLCEWPRQLNLSCYVLSVNPICSLGGAYSRNKNRRAIRLGDLENITVGIFTVETQDVIDFFVSISPLSSYNWYSSYLQHE